jgi:hypothetical protein
VQAAGHGYGPERDADQGVGDADQADVAERLPIDYVSYPGDAPHIFKALERDTAAVMVMEHI